MAKNRTDFEEKLEAIRNDNRTVFPRGTVKLVDMELDDDDAVELADALKQSRRIEQLLITRNNIGDRGITAIADALKNHPTLRIFFAMQNNIGDDGATAIADMCTTNQRIEAVSLCNNGIRDRGAEIIADMLDCRSDMVEINLRGNPILDEGRAALARAVYGGEHVNIVACLDNHPIRDRCDDNRTRAVELLEWIKRFPLETPPESEMWGDLADVMTRMPAIEYIAYWEKGSDQRYINSVYEFKEFIDELPRVDFSQPVTMETLTTKQGDYAPIDNPLTWQELDKVVGAMNQSGEYWGADKLLDRQSEDGMSSLMRRAAMSGKLGAFFNADNWKGSSVDDFNRVMEVMDDGQKTDVPNRHLIKTMLQRQETVTQRVR